MGTAKESKPRFSGVQYYTVVYLKNGNIFLFNNSTASDCRSTAEKLLKDPVRGGLVRCIRYSKADLGKHPEDGCWLGTGRI